MQLQSQESEQLHPLFGTRIHRVIQPAASKRAAFTIEPDPLEATARSDLS